MQLFHQIEKLITPAFPGWCTLEKAHIFAAAVVTLRPDVSVEIGVFGGKSFLPIALAHKEIGKGIAIGIDPWKAEASTEGYDEVNRAWWSTVDHEQIYREFMKQVDLLGVNHCVDIKRMKSDDVIPPDEIDFLHIDGQHTTQAVRDAERFGGNVRVGGLVFSDDIAWSGSVVQDEVRRSVDTLIAMGFKALFRCDTGMMLQRFTKS